MRSSSQPTAPATPSTACSPTVGLAGGAPLPPSRSWPGRFGDGRVEIGDRFSLNGKLERFKPRDPSNHLDGLWQYLYPSRPTT